MKYLGVIFDDRLTWSEHISNTQSKLRQTIYKFLQLRNFADLELLKTVYAAFVQSRLNFGLIGWGAALQNQTEKLTKIQKRILKVIYKKPRNFPSSELFKLAEVPTLRQLYIKQTIINTRKLRYTLDPGKHNHNTRLNLTTKIALPKPHTQMFKKSAFYTGISQYNNLPERIKNIGSEHTFRKKVLRYVMEKN